MRKALSFICFSLLALSAQGQSLLEGRIYGRDSLPLAGVSIQNINTKAITISNSEGNYSISAGSSDTLLFRAVGHVILALRAALIPRRLYLRPQIVSLAGVEIVKRSYMRDSLELREEFQKGFNFRRPKFGEVVTILPVGIGVNIHQLYRAVSFKKNRKADVFKRRLINYEHDRFIDQRYTPELVTKMTGLKGDSLQEFMNRHRPSFEFVKNASQYDLLLFIRQSAARYRQQDTVSINK